MTNSHRRWHFWLWLVITSLLVAGLVAGFLDRSSRQTATYSLGTMR